MCTVGLGCVVASATDECECDLAVRAVWHRCVNEGSPGGVFSPRAAGWSPHAAPRSELEWTR